MALGFGQQIRKLRKENGLTMKQLAELTGVTEQAISQYERNIRTPKRDIIDKIAKVLKVDVLELYPEGFIETILTNINPLLKLMDLYIKNDPELSWDIVKGFSKQEILYITNMINTYAKYVVYKRKLEPINDADIFTKINIKEK